MTHDPFEDFYAEHYLMLMKALRVAGASQEEAEDAVQKAMADVIQRTHEGKAPSRNPGAYVCKAAIRYFVKERERDRNRLIKEILGGHLAPEGQLDDQLTALEDDQYVKLLLALLSDAQREVFVRVMAGMTTREIAEELGKTDEAIRQNLKKSRDRLKQQPAIAPIAERNNHLRVVRSMATEPGSRKEGSSE